MGNPLLERHRKLWAGSHHPPWCAMFIRLALGAGPSHMASSVSLWSWTPFLTFLSDRVSSPAPPSLPTWAPLCLGPCLTYDFLSWCLNNIPACNIWIRFHPVASAHPMELQCLYQGLSQLWGCTSSHHCLGYKTPLLQNEDIIWIVTRSLGIRRFSLAPYWPRRKLVYFLWFMILEYKADFDISAGQGWMWRWLFTV